MNITTDADLYFQYGFLKLNATLLYSWIVMLFLIGIAVLINISIKKHKTTKLQNFFESLITTIDNQIKQIGTKDIELVFPFIATLFIYIITSNLISLIPTFQSPTASLSTTLALAFCTFIFSISIGIKEQGFFKYFGSYFKPVAILMPLNVVSQLSKIISLSFRLYGNIMSSGAIILILSNITFLSVGFPVLISLLSTISGVIQAYIFSILSMIAISSDN